MKRISILLLLCACARMPPADDWFERQRLMHREVDVLVQRSEVGAAVTRLQAALADDPPLGTPQEVAVLVRKDVLFRLAALHLRADHPEAALEAATQGLALGAARRDAFTVNLYLAQGRALERLRGAEAAAEAYASARALMTEP